MSAYFLHFGLKVLHKQFPQVVQRLQLTSNSVFEALNVVSSLLSSVKLSRQLCQPSWLLRLIVFQPLIVFHEMIMCQLKLLVGTKTTTISNDHKQHDHRNSLSIHQMYRYYNKLLFVTAN